MGWSCFWPLGSEEVGKCILMPGEGGGRPEEAPMEPRGPLLLTGKNAPWEDGNDEVVVAGECREENSSLVGVL